MCERDQEVTYRRCRVLIEVQPLGLVAEDRIDDDPWRRPEARQPLDEVARKPHMGLGRKVAGQESRVAGEPSVRLDGVDHRSQTLWRYALTGGARPSRVIGQDDGGELRQLVSERLKDRGGGGEADVADGGPARHDENAAHMASLVDTLPFLSALQTRGKSKTCFARAPRRPRKGLCSNIWNAYSTHAYCLPKLASTSKRGPFAADLHPMSRWRTRQDSNL